MTKTEKAIRKLIRKFPAEKRPALEKAVKLAVGNQQVLEDDGAVGNRLQEMLDEIDKFLSNHDGTYKEDARALWHIIGGATRGPDDEDGAAKSICVNLRGLAFPRTASLGTGTGAAFTTCPTVPTKFVGLPHFRDHASKALSGLKRAGRVPTAKQSKEVA